MVNLHVGSSGNTPPAVLHVTIGCKCRAFPVNGLEALVDWIFAGVPRASPT